jgi:hypothetical protein
VIGSRPGIAGDITFGPDSDGSLGRMERPTVIADGWRRTRQRILDKAAKDYGPTPHWVRIDVLDGLWQFTPWAGYSLADKVHAVATQLRKDLERHRKIAGLVLSSGATQAQGTFTNETYTSRTGPAGCRRVLPAGRVRDTVVVPLQVEASGDADLWLRMYDKEAN